MQEELATLEKIVNVVIEYLITYSFQILAAIIILIIGIKVAGWTAKVVERFGEQRQFDVTISKFLAGLTRTLILIFVFIIVVGKFGISIAPFIAALGAVAFGSSFALQGPLSNYGAGIVIILGRTFVVGDTIMVKSVNGVVEEIHLAATILTNEDGERITIPNKHIVGEILHNSFANKIVETSVGISYSDDPKKAVRVVEEVLKASVNVIQEPPPLVGVAEFADSAINIGMRYWVPTKKYFQISYRMNLAIHSALEEAGISIPFPQRDVHLIAQPDQKNSEKGLGISG